MLPPELKQRPFTLNEARAAGLSRKVLRGKSWRRIGPSLYCWVGLKQDPLQLLQAWHRRLPDAVFTGLSAAWLHRLDVDPSHPVEVSVPPASGIRSRPGLVVHRRSISDVVTVRELSATTLAHTFAELRRQLQPVEVLILADAALRLGLGRFDDLAEPAESPMETRLRWLLIQAGLPRPEVQANLSFGRADLFYRAAQLVIEYDGGNHRDRLVDDDRRQNALVEAGYKLLRYTAPDVYQRSELIVTQVRKALLA